MFRRYEPHFWIMVVGGIVIGIYELIMWLWH